MLRLMLILVLLLVVPEALCEPALACTILTIQLNIIFSLVTPTIKSLYVLYCIVLKKLLFWCDTKSKLAPGIHGGSNKISIFDNPLTGWVDLLQT